MTHDPLCPLIVDGVEGPLHLYECPCDLIAKVRQDEKEKAREALEAQAKRIIEMADVQAAVAAAMASDDMLQRCIAVILSMKDSDNCDGDYCRTLDAVANGVRSALEGKP